MVLAGQELASPRVEGVGEALAEERVDVRVFGKPSSRTYRRMAVALAYGEIGGDMDALREKAKRSAAKMSVR